MRSRRRHHFEPSRRPSNIPPLLLEPITPNRVNITVPVNGNSSSSNNNNNNNGIVLPTPLATEESTSSSQDARVITYM